MKTIYFLYVKAIITIVLFAIACRICTGSATYSYLVFMAGIILYCMFSLEKGSRTILLLFGIPIGQILKIPKQHLYIKNKFIKRRYTKCDVTINFSYFNKGTMICAVVEDDFYNTIKKHWHNISIDDNTSIHLMISKSNFIADAEWKLNYSVIDTSSSEVIPLYVKGITAISEIKLKYS